MTSHDPSRMRNTSCPMSPWRTRKSPGSNARTCSFMASAKLCRRWCDFRKSWEEQSLSAVNQVWFSASAAVRRVEVHVQEPLEQILDGVR